MAGGKMSCDRGRPPHRKYWTDTAAWKEGAMMTCLKEGLGIVARHWQGGEEGEAAVTETGVAA